MSAVGAVLDACVLVNASLRDTLLRLALQGLYTPYWSDEIIDELVRTLQRKLRKSPSQTAHLTEQLRQHFDDAWVGGYESLVPKMANDAKDRHVLACAVHLGARVIVTFNVRHFPPAALEPWLVEAQHPDDFLVTMYRQHPEILVHVLHEQAHAIRWKLNWVRSWRHNAKACHSSSTSLRTTCHLSFEWQGAPAERQQPNAPYFRKMSRFSSIRAYIIPTLTLTSHASSTRSEEVWMKVFGTLNEYQARLFAAEKAIELGRGGITHLARLTGKARVAITQGGRGL